MLSARATSRPFQVVGETPTRDPLRRVPGRRARAGHRRLAARLPRRLGGGTPARRRRRRELGRTGARREPVSARVSAVCGRCPQGPGPSHSTLEAGNSSAGGQSWLSPVPRACTCHLPRHSGWWWGAADAALQLEEASAARHAPRPCSVCGSGESSWRGPPDVHSHPARQHEGHPLRSLARECQGPSSLHSAVDSAPPRCFCARGGSALGRAGAQRRPTPPNNR